MGVRAEDVDWVQVLSSSSRDGEAAAAPPIVNSSSSPLTSLATTPTPPPPAAPTKFPLKSFAADYIKEILASQQQQLSPANAESIATQAFEHLAFGKETAISRDAMELGLALLAPQHQYQRIALQHFIVPLALNAPSQPTTSSYPCESLAERLVLQIKLDERTTNVLAGMMLNSTTTTTTDFSNLEMGFWQRCILNKELQPTVLEQFLAKLDLSAHTKHLASVVFTVIKNNKPRLTPHVATLRSILIRAPADSSMLFPAKRALAQFT